MGNYFDERTLPPDERRFRGCAPTNMSPRWGFGKTDVIRFASIKNRPAKRRNGVIMPGECTNGALWFS